MYNKLVDILKMNNRTNAKARRENENDYGFDNTWIRRYFRLFLDGSYTNYKDYNYNVDFLNRNKDNKRSIRAFVVGKFIDFLKLEFNDLSLYKIREAIKEAFDYSNKNKLALSLELI